MGKLRKVASCLAVMVALGTCSLTTSSAGAVPLLGGPNVCAAAGGSHQQAAGHSACLNMKNGKDMVCGNTCKSTKSAA